ncbi:MAG: extracellular solute-binding protein [Clostridia bacterium]|nr:extracellular solute-binding protein [Clostridia bacterium]
MTKRLLALILIAMFCFSAILMTACNGGGDDASQTGQSTADVSENENGEKPFPLEKKNWGGETVTIIAYNGRTYSTAIVPDEASDEPVVNAFYKRNAFIEQEYGIKFNLEVVEGWYSNGITQLRNDIDANLGEIQASCLAVNVTAPLGVGGYLYDISSIDNGYIHYEEPWWDQSLNRDLSIDNNIWFLAGDALVADDESTWAIYFNKDLVQSYQLEDPFDLVRSDEWTVDKMHEMVKSVQLMHGSAMSFDPAVGDVWGMVAQSYDCYAFMLGAAEPMVDAKGDTPVFRVMEEENISTFTAVMDLLLEDQYVGVSDFYDKGNYNYDNERAIFYNGNALFMPNQIWFVSSQELRNAEIHYGILPMPKRNEHQDEYSTSVSVYWCEVFAIPTSNVEKLDVTCYALEAMAYYGRKMVTPEYYDRTLKYKRFQDDDSTDMLEIIFSNRTYDLAGVFNFGEGTGSGALYFYTDLLGSHSYEIASHWESKQTAFENDLEDLITAAIENN